MSVHLFDGDQVPDRLEHATDLGTVLLDDHVADALETKRAEGVPVVLLAADGRPLLLDLEPCHYDDTSARAFSRRPGPRPRRAAHGAPRRPPAPRGSAGPRRSRARC